MRPLQELEVLTGARLTTTTIPRSALRWASGREGLRQLVRRSELPVAIAFAGQANLSHDHTLKHQRKHGHPLTVRFDAATGPVRVIVFVDSGGTDVQFGSHEVSLGCVLFEVVPDGDQSR